MYLIECTYVFDLYLGHNNLLLGIRVLRSAYTYVRTGSTRVLVY